MARSLHRYVSFTSGKMASLAGSDCHQLQLQQVGVRLDGVRGLHLFVADAVDKPGVLCITGISLGMSQIPSGER
jgi:hypothetical protein